MRGYNLFWDAEDDDRVVRFYGFIPQLAAVVAIVASLDWAGDGTIGECSLGARLSTMIEDWLRYPDKLTPTAILRIRCLLLLARLTDVDRVKRPHNVWVAAGDLFRFAVTQNFHRDPSELPGVSISRATVDDSDGDGFASVDPLRKDAFCV